MTTISVYPETGIRHILEACGTQAPPPKVDPRSETFWKEVATSIQEPWKVPGQLHGEFRITGKRIVNNENQVFNGRLVIECEEFVNRGQIFATGGVVIKAAQKVSNKGGQILSQLSVDIQTRSLTNTGGSLISAGHRVTLDSNEVDNTKGKIASLAGKIKWLGSYRSTFKNEYGHVEAGNGIIFHNRHSSPHPSGTLIYRALHNEHGFINSGKGSLDFKLDVLYNQLGTIRGNSSTLSLDLFYNDEGCFLTDHKSSITIHNQLTNEKGLLYTGGLLTASDGNWSNNGGLIIGLDGVHANTKAFNILKDQHGLIYSARGKVSIETQQSMSMYGDIQAATEIMLLSHEDWVHVGKGKLIVPQGAVTLRSLRKDLCIEDLTVVAGHFHADAEKWLHAKDAQLTVSEDLSFQAKMEIKGNRITLLGKSGKATFDAEKVTFDKLETKSVNEIHFNGSYIELSKSIIRSRNGCEFDATKRLSLEHMRYELEHGNIILRGKESVRMLDNDTTALEGTFILSSDGWVVENQGTTNVRAVTRISPFIDTKALHETAETVHNTALQTLRQDNVKTDASESLTCSVGERAVLTDATWTAPTIETTINELWIDRMRARFGTMSHKTEEAHLRALNAKGDELDVTSAAGPTTVTDSTLHVHDGKLDSQSTLTVTNTDLLGHFKTTSVDDQTISGGMLAVTQDEEVAGDNPLFSTLEATSTKGHVAIRDMKLHYAGDITARAHQGDVSVERVGGKGTSLSLQGEQASLSDSKLHLRGKLKVVAKKADARKGDIHAQSASFDADALDMHTFALETDQGVVLFKPGSRGLFTMTDSRVKAHTALKGHTKQILLVDSSLESETKEISLNSEGPILALHSQIAGPTVELVAPDVGLRDQSAILGQKTGIQASVYADKSVLSGDEKLNIHGQSLQLTDSTAVAEHGHLDIDVSTQNKVNSLTQAQRIDLKADTIYEKKSATIGDEVSRKAEQMVLVEGGSSSQDLDDQVDGHLILHEHTQEAHKLRQRAKIYSTMKSTYRSEDGSISAMERVTGEANRFLGKAWQMQAPSVVLPGTAAQVDSMNVTASLEVALPNSHLRGRFTINSGARGIDLIQSLIEGALHGYSVGDILVRCLQVTGETLYLSSGQAIYADRIQVQVSRDIAFAAQGITSLIQAYLKSGGSLSASAAAISAHEIYAEVTGNATFSSRSYLDLKQGILQVAATLQADGGYLNTNFAKMWASSIIQRGAQGISGVHSLVVAQHGTVEQSTPNGDLHIPYSETHSGVMIERTAGNSINHTYAKSIAPIHEVAAKNFDTSHGIIVARQQANVRRYIYNGATLHLTDGISTFNVDEMLSNFQSRMQGTGSAVVNSLWDYVQNAFVQLGGLYSVKASSTTINQVTQASTVSIQGTHGSVVTRAPVSGNQVALTAATDVEMHGPTTARKFTAVAHRGDVVTTAPHHANESTLAAGANVEFNAETRVGVLKTTAQTGHTSFNGPTEVNRIEATAAHYVSNTDQMKIHDTGKLQGSEFYNSGQVHAGHLLSIDQKNYQDPGVASAPVLHLASDSSIAVNRPLHGTQTLILESRHGGVNFNTRFHTRADLSVAAKKDVVFNRDVHVERFTQIITPENIIFDHVKTLFGRGVNWQAHAVKSLASDTHVVGNSRIHVDHFILSPDVHQSPVERRGFWFLGDRARNSPNPYDVKQSNFRHDGDLDLTALLSAVVDGSNFLVNGNMHLKGNTL